MLKLKAGEIAEVIAEVQLSVQSHAAVMVVCNLSHLPLWNIRLWSAVVWPFWNCQCKVVEHKAVDVSVSCFKNVSLYTHGGKFLHRLKTTNDFPQGEIKALWEAIGENLLECLEYFAEQDRKIEL